MSQPAKAPAGPSQAPEPIWMQKLRRISVIIRYVAILILVAVFGIVFYQLYDFYGNRMGLGSKADTAIETYFMALSQGDYARVYALTDKTRLTDIYGRPITQSEFQRQLQGLAGSQGFPFQRVESVRLTESDGWTYYLVTLHSSVGGSAGSSQLVVRARREGQTWIVAYPFPIIL
jgi:hypothetical protein